MFLIVLELSCQPVFSFYGDWFLAGHVTWVWHFPCISVITGNYQGLEHDFNNFALKDCFQNYEFDWLSVSGFMGAMISNLAFVFRNIFSKKGMKGKSVSGMNYYACLSMLSLLILTPFAIAVEGPQMWAAGWQTALSEIGPNFVW